MSRISLVGLAAAVALTFCGSAAGQEKTDKKPDKPAKMIAKVVSTDAESMTITVKAKGKDGKETERVIELKEGVRLVGEDGKEDKPAEFFMDLKTGEEIAIAEKDGKVVEVRDLPERGAAGDDKRAHMIVTVVKTDAGNHSITVKSKGKDGQVTERVIELKEGIKLVGEDGEEDKEAEFLKDLADGEEIDVILAEKGGKVVEIRDLPPKKGTKQAD